MNVVVSGKCWVDCANKGANKGSALRHFQEEYGITPDETLAFGDNLNDIEMLNVQVTVLQWRMPEMK